jgi:aspartate aminotransferase
MDIEPSKQLFELSNMQRRINYADSHPDVSWVAFAENVPRGDQAIIPLEGNRWRADLTNYANSAGTDELRAAICAQLAGRVSAVDPSNVLVTAGGMHGIGLIARDLASRRAQRVWCQVPLFRSVYDTFRAASLEVVSVQTEDLERKASELGPDDVLYVNSPHNPTGHVIDPATPLPRP